MNNGIVRLDAAIRAAGVPIDGVSGKQGAVRIDFQASATAGQRTQAQSIAASFDWSATADATASAQSSKTNAASVLQNGGAQAASPNDRLLYSLLLMVLDELNSHTTFEAALLAAIAAATNLANLQTRVAAVTAVPQRTAAQLRTAIVAKINATAE